MLKAVEKVEEQGARSILQVYCVHLNSLSLLHPLHSLFHLLVWQPGMVTTELLMSGATTSQVRHSAFPTL